MINLVFFCELEHLVIGEKIGSLGLYIKYNGEGGRTSLTLSEVNPKFTDPIIIIYFYFKKKCLPLFDQLS